MKKFLLAIALMAFGTTVSFAQNAPAAKKAKTEKTEKTAKSKKPSKAHKNHATAMYECPMKCEAPSAKAGKCGKCGMDLVAMKPKK